MEYNTNTYMKELLQKVKETQDEFILQTILPYCEEITQMEISKEELVDALTGYNKLKAENEHLKKKIEELEYAIETENGTYIYYWKDWHGEFWTSKITRHLENGKVEIYVRDLGVEIIIPENELELISEWNDRMYYFEDYEQGE